MFRRAMVVAVACGACIKLSGFHPLDGSGGSDARLGDGMPADAAPPGACGNGSSDMATASMSGSATICEAGPGYVLRFPAQGFQYPDELRIGTTDVLGTTTACNEESLIGMTAYPLPRFAADSPSPALTATASIVLAGPVVAKVAVTWSYKPTASCSSGTVFGHSTFTSFPDGRLVRYDEITTPAAGSQSTCDCASAAQGFIVSAYLTLDASLSPHVTDQGGSTISPGTGHGTSAPQLLCTNGSDWGVGIARTGPGRARTVTGGALSLTYDFDASLSHMLTAMTYTTVTAYQIGNAVCGPLLSAISTFMDVTSPQLHVFTTGSFDDTIGSHRDGIFGGDDDTGVGLPVGAGTITLTPGSGETIPPGWSIWLRDVAAGTPVANPVQTGDWYKSQTVGNDTILWFRNGLTGSATITVPQS